MSIIGTPEHREEMIEQYMTKGTHCEPRMSRKEAEAYYKWAFPGLTEQQCQEYIARQDLLGFKGLKGPFDDLDNTESEWFVSGEDFVAKELEPRAVYLSDKETGATVLFQASLNQLFATRGLGKSIVTNALLKCLIGGNDFLRLTSEGGLNVLLVDAELPPIQLQERLKQFGETGQLTSVPHVGAQRLSEPESGQGSATLPGSDRRH